MAWLTDPFQLEFMQRALLAGLLTVGLTSVVGTWVVIRGLTFMGDALAHGVLPGLALASLAGFDLTVGALLGAVVMVGGVHLVQRRSTLGEDSAIGLLFVGMLALGVIILSKSRSFSGDLTTFLFGDVLGVTGGDLWLQLGALVLGVAVAVALHRPFLALAFNRRTAELLGMHPRRTHLVMLALVALTVVSSFRAVGTLLVFGLLVGPPATASLFARRVPTMVLGSLVAGTASVLAGLLLSYHEGTAAGASMAAVAVGLFFVALVLREVTTWWRSRTPAPA